MRTSKERRKGNPPTPTTLSLYTIRLRPSNHSPCFDVSSESHPMILHTISTFPISTITPHSPTSQHLRPLPYHNTLSRHPLAASCAPANVSALRNNSDHFLIIIHYLATLSPLLTRLPMSQPFRNTVPSTPPGTSLFLSTFVSSSAVAPGVRVPLPTALHHRSPFVQCPGGCKRLSSSVRA